MHNFTFANPVKILFGRDVIGKLAAEAAGSGKKALLVYGGGSIRKNGVYDALTAALAANGVEVTEHPGVKPNPVLSHALEGIKKARAAGCDMVIAAGGGSVIDESKTIAAGVKYDGDVWDFFCGKAEPRAALPLFTVLTIPATGSEMNSGCVITNELTRQKYSAGGVVMFPKVSALDPETTLTLPRPQIGYGAVDSIAHIIEGYFTTTDRDAAVTDELVHALARSIISSTDRILADQSDYNARASMMWSATLALNGLPTCGYAGAHFINHAIEHALSAIYDIPHGAGLAIVMPAWFRRHLEKDGPARLAQFGKAVFGTATAEETIKAFEAFFKKAGAPVRLAEAGIPAEDIPHIAENAMSLIRLWGMKHEQPEIEKILRNAV